MLNVPHQHDERGKPLLLSATPSSPIKLNGHAATDSAKAATASTTAHTRPSIPALTGLRAALMLHVLIRNMRYNIAVDMFGWMVDAGAIGVSTFFCLSGFILAYCYGDHRFDTWRCYWSFIGRRYARLLPIYYISQLMCVGVEVNAVRQSGIDGWTVLHWLAFATGTHSWFPWRAPDNRFIMLNPTLWALSVVLFFYVTMPILMRAIRWFIGVERLSELPRSDSTSRLLWLCVAFTAITWIPLLAAPDDIVSLLWSMPYFRMGEFGLGLVAAALYLSVRQRQQPQQKVDGSMDSTTQVGSSETLIDRLASTPLLNSPLVLDVVTALTILLVILLALPSVHRPEFMGAGNWLAVALCYIILALALTTSPTNSSPGGRQGIFSWLLTRPIVLELGAMSFCFYAFHAVPVIYAYSIGIELNRSAAVEFCAAVGLAWMGYKYVETPVYHMLSARLPACRCHKG